MHMYLLLNEMLQVTKEKGMQCFSEAMQSLPALAATAHDQQRLLKAAFNATNLEDSSSSIGCAASLVSPEALIFNSLMCLQTSAIQWPAAEEG